MVWLVVACLVFVVVSHLIQVQKLDEILDWINQPDEEVIEEVVEPLGVTEIKAEGQTNTGYPAYFDSNNKSQEFIHLFNKQGSYVGVRAIGHPDTKDEHYNKFWPNGEACLSN